MAVDGKPGCVLDQGIRPHRIAEPPAGHGIGLRPAVQHNDAIFEVFVFEHADVLATVIQHPRIDFVGQYGDVRMLSETFGELVHFCAGYDAAGRVGRGVDDDQTRFRRDQAQNFFGGKRKAVFFMQRHRHGFGAGKLDHRFVNRKARVRIDDLGARLAEHQDCKKHRWFAARHDDDVVRVHFDLAVFEDIGFAHFGDAVGRRIAVMAVAHGLDRGFDDMVWGFEIGLTDP